MSASERSDAALLDAFRTAGQGHVLRWWDALDTGGRARLLAQLRTIDLRALAALIADVKAGRLREGLQGQAVRPTYIPLPRTGEEILARDRARAAGEALLRAGKVAALTVAGGQGTRLGFDAPKGTFPIGPVTGKSLFQIHAENIRATIRRYAAPVPWLIMTSEATDAPTREYFRQAGFFGLPADDVIFFCQRMMPALDRQFKLVLTARDRLLMSPNGHGGTLLALAENGVLDALDRRGVEQISYFQVDNPLAPAADPVFLGYHALAGAEMSSKALWKREPEEPIGAFVRVAGKLIVREYSDLTKEQMREESDGRLLYGLGSIAIHVLRVDFVRKETAGGLKLPFHLAEKSSPYLDESGALVQPTGKNVYKFETFIFDALRDTTCSVILEVRREAEFSPVKNATGQDSPESCRRDMTALYGAWLAEAGVFVPRDRDGRPAFPIEISPLYALDCDELAAKAPRTLDVSGPLYLGPAEGS